MTISISTSSRSQTKRTTNRRRGDGGIDSVENGNRDVGGVGSSGSHDDSMREDNRRGLREYVCQILMFVADADVVVGVVVETEEVRVKLRK